MYDVEVTGSRFAQYRSEEHTEPRLSVTLPRDFVGFAQFRFDGHYTPSNAIEKRAGLYGKRSFDCAENSSTMD